MPSSGIAVLYSISNFSFLRNLHTVLHSGCINLHPHQGCKTVPFSSHPLQHLLFVDVLMMGILTSVKSDLHSLIISTAKHPFMCLLAICISTLEKSLCRSFAHFRIRLFVFLILSYMSCLYVFEINPLSVASFANIFSHSEGCLFIFLMVSFAVPKVLRFIKCHLFIFVFISISLRGGSKRILLCFTS